jgi:hypothetical protein
MRQSLKELTAFSLNCLTFFYKKHQQKVPTKMAKNHDKKVVIPQGKYVLIKH